MYNAVLSGFGENDKVLCDLILLQTYTALLTVGGTLIVKTVVGTGNMVVKYMKMCGLLNVAMSESVSGVVIGNMPTYKVDTWLM